MSGLQLTDNNIRDMVKKYIANADTTITDAFESSLIKLGNSHGIYE